MNTFFNINIEFDKITIDQKIKESIKKNQKGYVCIIDGNVLFYSYHNHHYRNILNNSLINTCDGSSIALLINSVYKTKYSTYTGPEILSRFIISNYKQLFLGNTEKILDELKEKIMDFNISDNNFIYKALPFNKVDEFNYLEISKFINFHKPDIIWVSLGAPKQELFIEKLYPLIDSGVLIAIGAAVNIIIDKNVESKFNRLIKKLHIFWLLRIIKEPKRVGKRALKYFLLIPRLYLSEHKTSKKQKNATNT